MYYLKRKENTACWAFICLEEFFVFTVLEKIFPCKTVSKYLKAYNAPAYWREATERILKGELKPEIIMYNGENSCHCSSMENSHLQKIIKNFGGLKSPSRDTLGHSVSQLVYLSYVKLSHSDFAHFPSTSTIVWKIYPVWYNCISCDFLLSPKSSCSPPPNLLLTVPLMSHCEIISQTYSEMPSVFKSRRIICILWSCRKFLKDSNYFLLLSFSSLMRKSKKKPNKTTTLFSTFSLSISPQQDYNSPELIFLIESSLTMLDKCHVPWLSPSCNENRPIASYTLLIASYLLLRIICAV